MTLESAETQIEGGQECDIWLATHHIITTSLSISVNLQKSAEKQNSDQNMSDAKAIKLQSFNNKLEVRVSNNLDTDSGFAGVHGIF